MTSKASHHFVNNGFDDQTKKRYMTCMHCSKKLINSGNSNCMVSHLSRCRPDLYSAISNKIQSYPKKLPVEITFIKESPIKRNFFELNHNSTSLTPSAEALTPIKASTSLTSSTPIKSFLLSKTPYGQASSERLKLWLV